MLAHPSGAIFRNTNGKPRTTDAVNCGFLRLQMRMGREEMERCGETISAEQIAAFIPTLKRTRKRTRRKRAGSEHGPRAFLKTLLTAEAMTVNRGVYSHQFWGHSHEPLAQYNHAGSQSLRPPIVPWRLTVEGPGGKARGEFPQFLEICEKEDSTMSRVELKETEGQAGASLPWTRPERVLSSASRSGGLWPLRFGQATGRRKCSARQIDRNLDRQPMHTSCPAASRTGRASSLTTDLLESQS